MVIEYGMRISISEKDPIELLSTAPGGVGNYVMAPLAIFLMILSLRQKD